MAHKTEAAQGKKSSRTEVPCLVFDLEYTAYPGGDSMYRALEASLKKRDIELTPVLFARHGLACPTPRRLNRLLESLGQEKHKTEELAEEIDKHFRQALEDSQPSQHLCKVLQEAAANKTPLGVISGLDEELTRALIDRLKLPTEPLLLHQAWREINGRTRPEPWLQLAVALQAVPSQCVALTACAAAANSALVAGMHCVVIPDNHSAFQDFGGADMVIENPRELQLQPLLALVTPFTRN
ncbi:MAG: hypothetical protein ABR497_04860 [Kiritimatiellia bacterium]|nr:hypothetical protein [Lentisphaerota bacterium]